MNVKELLLSKRKAGHFDGQDLYMILTAIKETAESHPDVIDLLEDMKQEGISLRINLFIPDTNRKASVLIENGKMEFTKTNIENPTLSLSFPEQIGLDVLLGKNSFQSAYRNGQIRLEGQLSKAAAVAMILSICADEYNVF